MNATWSKSKNTRVGPVTLEDADLDVTRGGSGRRIELDHAGAYGFTVEIEGINAGHIKSAGYIGETEKN